MDTAYKDRRKHRRYQLEQRVHAVFHSGDSVIHLDAVSKNASVTGLQMETRLPITDLSPVSFIMTLESGVLARTIELRGEGAVVRVERKSGGIYLLAVQYKHPLTEIEEHPVSAS